MTILSIYYPPDGVVLDVLGIKAGIELGNRFECTKPAVDSNEQQFKLSIRRTMRQSFF